MSDATTSNGAEDTAVKSMEALAEQHEIAKRMAALLPPENKSGQNPDSLARASKDMGKVGFRVKAKVLKHCPRCMYYKIASGRILLRNRPAFFAWYAGFGVGPDAVEAWRKWAYERGQKEIALELEPTPTRFYRSSKTIASMVAKSVAGGGDDDCDE